MDLEDLQAFFETMLTLNKRRLFREDSGISFKTPEAWLKDPGVRQRYEKLVFKRDITGNEAAIRVMGVGHKVFDQSIEQANDFNTCFTSISGIEKPLAVFVIYDRVTSKAGNVQQIVVGVSSDKMELLMDWHLIRLLNKALKNKKMEEEQATVFDKEELSVFINNAEKFIASKIEELNTPFEIPDIKQLSLLIPSNMTLRKNA